MISADKISIADRELAGNLDRRFGRKWIYLGAGASALIVLLFSFAVAIQTKRRLRRPPGRSLSPR